MGHYKANLRDIEFNLFEVLGRQGVLGTAPYDDLDVETVRSMLTEVERLATHELAESFMTTDRTPPVYDPVARTVTMPDDFRTSYEAYKNGGWTTLAAPADAGGMPIPSSLQWAVSEMILGSNPGVHMYSSGPAFAHVFWSLATDEQKTWAVTWAQHFWGATMVLTEPDAGSDVGAGRTKAIPQADGSWHIEGVKRFITSAEHDLEDNIIHLVLARPEGVEGVGGPGTKGLSLFIVPKIHVDWATGELGARNGVEVHQRRAQDGPSSVSTTCELTFGDKAYQPSAGSSARSTTASRRCSRSSEFARMMVGTKAIATLSTGLPQRARVRQERACRAPTSRR